MKTLRLCVSFILILTIVHNSGAQTFTTASDTAFTDGFVCVLPTGGGGLYEGAGNRIFNPSPSALSLNWQIINSNFPHDWIPAFSFTDTLAVYSNAGSTFWDGVTGSTQSTTVVGSGSEHFDFQINEDVVTTSGTYWLEIQFRDPASSYSKNIWFVVSRDLSTLRGSITGVSQVCLGNTITLSGNLYSSAWSAANTHATISGGVVTGVTAGLDTIMYAGITYVHTGTDSCGIHDTVTKIITVNASPTPVVSGFGGQLTTSGSFMTYQWLSGAVPILGATSSIYYPTSNGNYAVTVTDSDGCTATSSLVFDANVGVPSINALANAINVYPNPVSSVLHIESPSKINVQVTTLDGNVVADGKDIGELDLHQLPAGIYLLSVYDAQSGIKLKTGKITKAAE